MKQNMIIKGRIALVLSLVFLLLGSLVSRKALAEEIAVTGNGADSNNEVNVSSSSNTNVQSTNTTNVDNTVQTNANTGNNSVSDNTSGNTQVQTGTITTTTNIQNAANTSIVAVDNCCPIGSTNVTVAGNGSGSNNTANVSTSQTNNATISNAATITNNITVNANTGGNTANDNSGNVFVKTGNISVYNGIKNASVNKAIVAINTGKSGDLKLEIAGNGADSQSTINYIDYNTNTVFVDNYTNIFNNVLFNLDTGNNDVNDNNGNVTLITGDIAAVAEITNAVNTSKVSIECECKEKPQPTPTPPVTPTEKVTPSAPSQPSGGNGGGGGVGGGGEVAGIAVGKVLPVTGNNWLFLAFVGNVLMLLLGTILRLRSGNSPGALAVA